jgi:hypothetical protein
MSDLDLDVWRMNGFESAKEIIRLRRGIRTSIAGKYRKQLAELLPEQPSGPLLESQGFPYEQWANHPAWDVVDEELGDLSENNDIQFHTAGRYVTGAIVKALDEKGLFLPPDGEVERLREGIRKFLAATGNDLCHENRVELAELLPEKPCTKPRPLPFFRFMWNCLKYRVGLSRYCSSCKRK